MTLLTPRHRMLLLFVPILMAVAVRLNSLANGFALDDVPIIQGNPRVHSLMDWRGIWLTPYWPTLGEYLGLWRPLAIWGYALQWAAGNGSPLVFHCVSIGLHALVTALVFLLLERLTATVPASLGALLFAVHPLHTEAVANVVGQAELLAAAAVLGACLVYAARPQGTGVPWATRAGIVVLFGLALLAKENAAVLPALLLTIDLTQRRIRLSWNGLAAYLRDVAVPLVMAAGVAGAWLVLRHDVLGGSLTGMDPGPSLQFLREEHRVLNALRAFPEIVRLLVLPWRLAADYSPAMLLPVYSVSPMVILGGLLVAGLATVALLTPVRPLLGLPAAWLIVSIITVSNLLFPIGVLVAERTLYLPSVAVSAALAAGWYTGGHRMTAPGRRLALAGFAVVLLLFGYRAWDRNTVWASTVTVQNSLIREHPESYKAQWIMAERLWRAGRNEEAGSRFRLALRIYDHDSQLHAHYGEFLVNTGDAESGLRHLDRAHAINPYVPRYVVLRAWTNVTLGRYPQALDLVGQLERLGSSAGVVLPIRAAALEGIGDVNGAVGVLRYMVRTAPPEPVPFLFVARQLARLGFPGDALETVAAARAAAGDDPDFAERADRVEHAIRTGCYAATAPRAAAEQAAGRGPTPALGGADGAAACDPLAN